MIADRIKLLRENKKITQSDLAKKLGITRSAVNAWEMGITVPSTQYVTELAVFFGVSSDYLLDLPDTKTLSVEGLSDEQISLVSEIISCFRKSNEK